MQIYNTLYPEHQENLDPQAIITQHPPTHRLKLQQLVGVGTSTTGPNPLVCILIDLESTSQTPPHAALTEPLQTPPPQINSSKSLQHDQTGAADGEDTHPLVKQCGTNGMDLGELKSHVRDIYKSILILEAKSLEIYNKYKRATGEGDIDGTQPNFTDEQWQALTQLYRSSLHECYDFLLASQHPIASSTLRGLALEYHLPERVWQHVIQRYLELLHCRMPQCLEHMTTFLFLAYDMMALFYETIPAFQQVWANRLGDLCYYFNVIQDESVDYDAMVAVGVGNNPDTWVKVAVDSNPHTWADIARLWYSKTGDMRPDPASQYNPAALVRTDILQVWFLYCGGGGGAGGDSL